jgi:hypothetical protein
MYSIQEKSYKIVPITNLTKLSTSTKSCTKGKIKMILVKKSRKNTMPDGELACSSTSICFGRLCL